MAAVAGSVADELIDAFKREGVSRAFINNGGDIAFHLTEGQQYRVGVFADLSQWLTKAQRSNGWLRSTLTSQSTQACRDSRHRDESGWRGRSFSLGIADSVAVLAGDAASAGRGRRDVDDRKRGEPRSCGHRAAKPRLRRWTRTIPIWAIGS